MNTLVKGLNIWHFLSFFVVISCSLDIGHESKFIFDLARTTETKKSIECLMDDWQNCPCSLVIESLAGNSCWFLNKNIPHIFFFFCRIFSLFSHQPFTSPPSHLLILLFKWNRVASSRLFLFPFSSALHLFTVVCACYLFSPNHNTCLDAFYLSNFSLEPTENRFQLTNSR